MTLLKEQSKECKGKIFNIQRFSVNDGIGIRTIVFLKGCPLRCKWCSNPESQEVFNQLIYNEKNCIGCGRCIKKCTKNAIYYKDDKCKIDWDKCDSCGECTDECFGKALEIEGKEMTVEEVIDEIKKDYSHFLRSNGGLTISGGEPLMQGSFTKNLLLEAKKSGINTAIETTAYAKEEEVREILPLVDMFLLDIKSMDDEKHIKFTGVSNKIIIENARLIAEEGREVIIRVPIIPSFNDDKKSIREIARFVRELEVVDMINLLPYHKLGVNKYTSLGRQYELENLELLSEEKIESLKEEVLKEGLLCKIS